MVNLDHGTADPVGDMSLRNQGRDENSSKTRGSCVTLVSAIGGRAHRQGSERATQTPFTEDPPLKQPKPPFPAQFDRGVIDHLGRLAPYAAPPREGVSFDPSGW